MTKQNNQKVKTGILFMALIAAVLLGCMTFLFVAEVQEQLWQQSISTITESTRQGCNTLLVQLEDEYKSMETVAGYLNTLKAGQTEELEETISGYAKVNRDISLYFTDGTCYPSGSNIDEEALKLLNGSGLTSGIIDPHINSITGVNVFNLYIEIRLQDGKKGYLLKEYQVDKIVDSFSVSFYNDTGFSYVMDTKGNILIRPAHPNSNKTVQNLFDMLPEEQNDWDSLQQFRESLQKEKAGWAVFHYQREDTVFCYIPLGLGSDWYFISIIPKDVVKAQTNEILTRTLILITSILFGITLLVIIYFRNVNRNNHRLRIQADYIEHLYNAVPEGIALLTVEEPYRFLQLNREGMRLLAYPQNCFDFEPKEEKLEKMIYAEDYEVVSEILKAAAASGEKNHFESRAVKADGSIFWIACLVEKTLDENGTPIFITTFHDITAEKLAEEETERAKRQERIMLVSAISNVFPVIVSLNLTTDALKFIYVQEGLMVEMGEQKTYSQLYYDFIDTIHPDNIEEYKRRFAPEHLADRLGKERNEVFLEARQMLTDGQYHWTSTQIISVDNPYSDDRLAILLSRRIDEQRYEEEQKRQVLESALENAKAASVAKSQFLSNMSHDIRTPMNAIVGMTAIASAHLDERERVTECLKKIDFSSHHLLSLINDILDMSKIESGKICLRQELFNLAELIGEAVELIQPQAQMGKIEINVQMSALNDELVVGDPLRIRQIYLNILSNAVKYTPEGGCITINVGQETCHRKEYQNYVFQCADTGTGMSEEFLSKLYQPFERAQDSTTSKITGTGLGLAITKNFVDMMSGDIYVKSKLGEGSVFTVTLPLKLQNAKQEEIPREWEGVHSLIVDDDRETCENAAELLVSMGLRAEFVTDGITAVSRVAAAKDTPDPIELVILDWKMPEMDGVETARRIRSEVGPDIPVIILTAYDWAEIETEATKAGVTAFLSKPFYRSKICYVLRELGENKKTEEENLDCPQYSIGGRVLLAEDNEMNREIAHVLIEEAGVKVEEACNGAEAVKMVEESDSGYYDLIFMDIQMPIMDGYEAAKAIRKLERPDAAKIPIVAMTANALEDDMRAAARAGMDAHFAKPINVKKLEELLRKYIKGL